MDRRMDARNDDGRTDRWIESWMMFAYYVYVSYICLCTYQYVCVYDDSVHTYVHRQVTCVYA